MNWKQIKAQIIDGLKKAGIISDEKAADAIKALDAIEEPKAEPAIDPSKVTDPNLKAIVEAMQQQNQILAQQVKDLTSALGEEKTQRDNAIKAQQEKAKKDAEQKVTDLVARAKKEGKIPEAKVKWLTDFATKDIVLAEEWVKDAPVDKNFKAPETEKGKQAPQESSTSSMKHYMEHRADTTAELVAALTPGKN